MSLKIAGELADKCPKCGGILVQFDEGISVGLYCMKCHVLFDEFGIPIISEKEE